MIGWTAVVGCLACGGPLEPVTACVLDGSLGRAEGRCPDCRVTYALVVSVTPVKP